MKFFISDQHFGHNNIIDYCNRPFKNSNIMDRELIRRHNAIVNKDDIVYMIGDFSLKSSTHKEYLRNILDNLKGEKHLILGNHDYLKPFDYIDIGFKSVHTSLEVEEFVLVHDPSVSCINRNKLFICGHVHDLFKTEKNVINVSVEMWSYAPVSLEEINTISITYNEQIKQTQGAG